jgi:hypothetical protein
MLHTISILQFKGAVDPHARIICKIRKLTRKEALGGKRDALCCRVLQQAENPKKKKKKPWSIFCSTQAGEVDSCASLPFALECLSMNTSSQGKSSWQWHVCTGKKWPGWLTAGTIFQLYQWHTKIRLSISLQLGCKVNQAKETFSSATPAAPSRGTREK